MIALITVTIPVLAVYMGFIYDYFHTFIIDLITKVFFMSSLALFIGIEYGMMKYVWTTKKE